MEILKIRVGFEIVFDMWFDSSSVGSGIGYCTNSLCISLGLGLG